MGRGRLGLFWIHFISWGRYSQKAREPKPKMREREGYKWDMERERESETDGIRGSESFGRKIE